MRESVESRNLITFSGAIRPPANARENEVACLSAWELLPHSARRVGSITPINALRVLFRIIHFTVKLNSLDCQEPMGAVASLPFTVDLRMR